MAITLSIRGSFTAYHSGGSNLGFPSDSAAVTSAADATALSGNSFSMSATTNEIVHFQGFGNASGNRTMSKLFRWKPNYTGTPASNRPLFQLGLGRGAEDLFWNSGMPLLLEK